MSIQFSLGLGTGEQTVEFCAADGDFGEVGWISRGNLVTEGESAGS